MIHFGRFPIVAGFFPLISAFFDNVLHRDYWDSADKQNVKRTGPDGLPSVRAQDAAAYLAGEGYPTDGFRAWQQVALAWYFVIAFHN